MTNLLEGGFLLALIFSVISVVMALAIYPSVHNTLSPCGTYNGTHTTDAACVVWKNTTPLTGIETALLSLITLIFPAAIALTPVGLLYLMSRNK